jgi:biotin-dependent carboxylase-like uncharacterized protein
VGNPPEAAALEITIAGPTLRTSDSCLIAVTGADLTLWVNDWEMPPWMAIFVRRGWTIRFGDCRCGCRAYLAIAGGIDVSPVMGSRSTYLSGGFGGFEGRALRQGDIVPVGQVPFHLPSLAGRSFPPRFIPNYSDTPELHVVLGPQDDYFSVEGVTTLLSGEYWVDSTSDRMGYRLNGPEIVHKGASDGGTTIDDTAICSIISDGIPLGAVQVPPDRQPIVMMADRQTTGGYPKIATVISADIPMLAQCLPGQSTVKFKAVRVGEAQQRYRRMMRSLISALDAGRTMNVTGHARAGCIGEVCDHQR